MNENKIIIKNLHKEYKVYNRKIDRLLESLFPFLNKHNVHKAIKNFDLEVKEGEVLGLVGINGAGKSTLLKMITGVVIPTKGQMKINGKISSLLELGTAFNPELTGYENIYQHGQVMGLSKKEIKEKEEAIINFADIGDYISQPVKTYSSGMFARLAFACAINVDPDILIVDEVLSVGDIAFQLKCFKKFEDFKKQGKTILFVSHGLQDILKNCTRVVLVSKGKKVFDGNTKEGVDIYKQLVAGLIKEDDLEELTNQKIQPTINKDDWKSNFNLNNETLVYGTKAAEIIDYGIFDKDNNIKLTVDNDNDTYIKMKVKFNEDIENPIFAIAIKDFQGLELAGINTNELALENRVYKKDDEVIITFKQKIPLVSGKYTLSFGCTNFNSEGNLEIYNRLYDCLIFEVVTKKSTLGIVTLDSDVIIK